MVFGLFQPGEAQPSLCCWSRRSCLSTICEPDLGRSGWSSWGWDGLCQGRSCLLGQSRWGPASSRARRKGTCTQQHQVLHSTACSSAPTPSASRPTRRGAGGGILVCPAGLPSFFIVFRLFVPESIREKLSFWFLTEEITAVPTLCTSNRASPNFHTWYRDEVSSRIISSFLGGETKTQASCLRVLFTQVWDICTIAMESWRAPNITTGYKILLNKCQQGSD